MTFKNQNQNLAIAALKLKPEICQQIFHIGDTKKKLLIMCAL